MNILMLVSWYTKKGSTELEAGVFHNEQSRDLEKYCNMAIYYPFDSDIEEEYSEAEEWGIRTFRSKYYAGLKNISATKKIISSTMERIIDGFKPDLIHAHCGYPAGYFARYLSEKYNIPYIVTEHNPIELSRVDKPGLNHFFFKKAYSHSRANICVSKDSRSKLAGVYKKCQFDVIYNGIILPDYEKKTRKYYRDGYLNIVIVAVLYDLEIKGMKYLLEAVSTLKKQGKKVFLHHIGGGEYLGHFKEQAALLGIDDVCEFHGKCERSKLYEIVNEMDFFVSASLMECSGVSVQEAMLLGKPVLGTNSGGVDSLVPEYAGMIVKKADSGQLVYGIQEMEKKLTSFDTERIKQYALSNFWIENISKKYYELYKNITGESGE